ncbi:MAG: PTS fructose transporter subunit IIA [Rhodobacteraceae bacterium]|nr:PTS fructose transporter subunit IIA [Paracoccaceae bacterium]MCY4197524.1 PTS fructose transporter subunit IIA [Paracoccaceae bacterium]
MIGVVIVANGNMACELLACLIQIVGEQPGITAVSLSGEYNREQKQEEICRAVARVDEGNGVVVVTDLYGSSPANLAMKACGPPDRVILAGANLPMLVKLVKSRRADLQVAASRAAESGRKYVQIFD